MLRLKLLVSGFSASCRQCFQHVFKQLGVGFQRQHGHEAESGEDKQEQV